MKRIPEDFECDPETIMSNYDHQINEEVAERVKKGKLFSQYSGWNFCGEVWYEEKWNCEVWIYKQHVKTFTAKTLEEIMKLVSDRYGYK